MAFAEQLHPRGTGAQGGQFVAKGQSSEKDTVGYDAKRGTGAGYGTKSGDARVKRLQTVLNNMGVRDSQGNPLKVDGKLGPKTTAAIMRLQRRLGLKPDGLVTPGLLRHIQHVAHKAHVKVLNQKHKAHVAHKVHEAHKAHVSHQAKQHAAHQAHINHQKNVAAKKAATAKKTTPRKAAR